MRLTRLADWVRAEGVTVVESPGWQARARAGSFRPVGVSWHHTVGRSDRGDPAPSLSLVHRGRPDLPGPLCQLLPAWDGRVHLIAAGRANHAGTARPRGPVPGGDGNALRVGFELDYDPDHQDGPSPAQYRATIAATAGVLRYLRAIGQTPPETPREQAQRAASHAETSVTGKWDPGRNGRRSIPMGPWRQDLAAALSQPPGAWYTGTVEDDVTPEDREAIVNDVLTALGPVLDGISRDVAAAREVANGARTQAGNAAAGVAHMDAALLVLGSTVAGVPAAVVDRYRRDLRTSTARYDTPGVGTYDQLAAAASTYLGLTAPSVAGAPTRVALSGTISGVLT